MTEGGVCVKKKLTKKQYIKMLNVVGHAIEDWRYFWYTLKIKSVDKAEYINHCLKKEGFKDTKYEYFG